MNYYLFILRYEGFVLLLLYAAYILLMYFNSSIDAWITPKFSSCEKQNSEEQDSEKQNSEKTALMTDNNNKEVPLAILAESEDEGLFEY